MRNITALSGVSISPCSQVFPPDNSHTCLLLSLPKGRQTGLPKGRQTGEAVLRPPVDAGFVNVQPGNGVAVPALRKGENVY
ncbi:MAG: hypothetical protein ACUZ8I_02220 [Candidatus Scalindua sp.]